MARAARCNRLWSASLGSANKRIPESGCELASDINGEAAGVRSLNWLADFSATCGAEAQPARKRLKHAIQSPRFCATRDNW